MTEEMWYETWHWLCTAMSLVGGSTARPADPWDFLELASKLGWLNCQLTIGGKTTSLFADRFMNPIPDDYVVMVMSEYLLEIKDA